MKNLVPCSSSLVFSKCTSKGELGKLQKEAVVAYFKAEYPVFLRALVITTWYIETQRWIQYIHSTGQSYSRAKKEQ